MTSVTPDDDPGLRERRRRRTERDINLAALDLFEQQGVEATTVDEIAHAAGISPRTFFRYFATKEEAALLSDHAIDVLVESHLDALRADDPLVPQLERVWETVFHVLVDDSSSRRQMLRVRRLVRDSAAMRAAASRLDEQRLDDLVDRLGALVEADRLRLRVVAELVGGPVRVAFDAWADAADEGRDEDLPALYERCRAVARDELV